MHRFGLKTVFSKLFASVMLTLVLFAIAMITLTHLVHDNSAMTRWQVLAKQIVNQIDPFVDELDGAIDKNQRLQARFMLAVIKKSFDIFDESLQAKMGLYDREGNLLIQTDDSDLPKVLPQQPSWLSKMIPSFSTTPAQTNVQALGDRGYTLLYEPRNPPKRSEIWAVLNLFTGTLALLVIMTIVLWWIARSMTWRLNQMSRQMTHLGEGDFSVRVPAKGTDEIASLARGFNQAAQKIEQLINANNLLLAHASHELRTPITRIRLQIEMMEMLCDELSETTKNKFHQRAQAVNRDLIGLNDLVESILLVSRLDAGHAAQKNEQVDLLKLIEQECQHYPEAHLYGSSVLIQGQPKLLIHLIRNLLNNALIHGIPPIQVHLYGVAEVADAITPPDNLPYLGRFSDDIDAIDSKIIENAEVTEEIASPNEASTPDKLTHDDTHHAIASNSLASPTLPDNPTSLDNPTLPDSSNAQPISTKNKVTHHHAPSKTSAQDDNAPISSNTKKSKSEMSITKRLRRPKAEKPVKPPKFAVLAVIDQGHGIPLDKRQEIFSPFVRLQQKKKGSGIGLSLVAQIVDAHQGHIRTDTYKGHTRFIVILPTDPKISITKHRLS